MGVGRAWRAALRALLLAWLSACAVSPAAAAGAAAAGGAKARLPADGSATATLAPTAGAWGPLKLLARAAVEVRCPSARSFTVYVGASAAEAERKAAGRAAHVWCSWARGRYGFGGDVRAGGDGPVCGFGAAPHRDVHVAVIARGAAGGRAPAECAVSRTDALSPGRAVGVATGVLVFLAAPALARSAVFRLFSGGVLVAATSGLLLAYVLSRHVPRRTGAALVAALSSTVSAGLRYYYGSWLPAIGPADWRNLAVLYLAVSFAVGVGLTYVYDEPELLESPRRSRFTLLFSLTLRAAGLTGIVHGIQLPVVSAVVCGLLVAHAFLSGPIAMFMSALRPLAGRRKGAAADAPPPPRPSPRPEPSPRTPKTPAFAVPDGLPLPPNYAADDDTPIETPRTVTPAVAARAVTPGIAAATPGGEDSPLVRKGLILNEDTGKTIGIGKAKYNELVIKGYVVDRVAGVISPPGTRTPRTPAAAGTPAAHTVATPRTGGSTSPLRRRSSRFGSSPSRR